MIVPFAGEPKRVKLDPLYSDVSKAVDKLREWTRQLPPDPPALSWASNARPANSAIIVRPKRRKLDSLYLLDKMTPKMAAKYQKKGIFTLTQLSYVYRPRRRPKKSLGKIATPFNVELQALAIRDEEDLPA